MSKRDLSDRQILKMVQEAEAEFENNFDKWEEKVEEEFDIYNYEIRSKADTYKSEKQI